MACKPGDLVLIPFPYSDLQSTKKRPVMVLTSPDRHEDFIGLATSRLNINNRHYKWGGEFGSPERFQSPVGSDSTKCSLFLKAAL